MNVATFLLNHGENRHRTKRIMQLQVLDKIDFVETTYEA